MRFNNSYKLVIIGSAFGTREQRQFTFTGPVNLHAGTNRIALLSIAVGLPVSTMTLSVKSFVKLQLKWSILLCYGSSSISHLVISSTNY